VAKHRRKWNASVYQQYIREGRGQGEGIYYKPWITIQDFASRGMASRVKGQTTRRIHHLMSNLETSLFYLLDWSDNVTDIREQYPLLDLTKVIEISEKAQIRYPYDPVSGFPYVLTSDFFITMPNGTETIAVKPSSELEKPRVLEKLEVERRYWLNQGVNWRLITEHEINQTKARNIEWLAQANDLTVFGMRKSVQVECIRFFETAYPHYLNALDRLLLEIEQEFDLDVGMGMNVYKHMAYHKKIHINIDVALSPTPSTVTMF